MTTDGDARELAEVMAGHVDARRVRDRTIAEAHARGMSMRQIAAATGLSPSRIAAICAQHRKDRPRP